MLSQDRKMNSTLNHCTYFLCYRKFFSQDTTLQKGQKIRALILVEKPKLIERWQSCMNENDEMTK